MWILHPAEMIKDPHRLLPGFALRSSGQTNIVSKGGRDLIFHLNVANALKCQFSQDENFILFMVLNNILLCFPQVKLSSTNKLSC